MTVLKLGCAGLNAFMKAHHSNRSVIPRLRNNYEELRYAERNPDDCELSMKKLFVASVQGKGILLSSTQHFIDNSECADDGSNWVVRG